jgi:hypothetical protein
MQLQCCTEATGGQWRRLCTSCWRNWYDACSVGRLHMPLATPTCLLHRQPHAKWVHISPACLPVTSSPWHVWCLQHLAVKMYGGHIPGLPSAVHGICPLKGWGRKCMLYPRRDYHSERITVKQPPCCSSVQCHRHYQRLIKRCCCGAGSAR